MQSRDARGAVLRALTRKTTFTPGPCGPVATLAAWLESSRRCHRYLFWNSAFYDAADAIDT